MQFTLVGPNSGTFPFTVGFAFKQGDIPSGRFVATSLANAQASVKNSWPDGSVKFAVVSGRATLAANTATTVTLSSSASAPAGSALTLTQLKATNAVASIGCGSYGTVTWQTTDWDTPFQTWVSGPEMSSWIYRKPVGSDPHLVGWLEVRLYVGGVVEVLPWVENGFIRVAGPTSKSATFTFTLGSTQRFSTALTLPHHTRTPLVSGSATSYWLDIDPNVVPRHDTAYLQATRLVPTYTGTVAANAAIITLLPSTFTPLAQGVFNYDSDNMGAVGFQYPIGLLPWQDVLYLTCTAAKTYSAVVFGGMSAGRYPTHYRDENTNRPLRFSQYPNISLNASTTGDYPPATSGTAPPGWDIPHHPSLGYMAYLVTGRWYFMEEVQFSATMNYITNVDGGQYTNRNFSNGLFLADAGANTVRGAAWALRTLSQAVTVTPDADTALRGELIASLEANITFNHTRYVAQTNNPFGFVKPYGGAYGPNIDAAWQQDFYTAAFGYMLAMNPPVSATVLTKLQAFFAWKAQSVIGRLGGTSTSEWLYRDATPYTMILATSTSPDFDGGTGPWDANWGVLYNATYTTSPGPRTAGDLRGGNFPDGTSYWGNLQPAIAYAVEHGVAGAATAYARMTGASNYPQLVATFNTNPLWGVRPRG